MGVSPYGSVVLNHAADAFADLASAEVQLPPAIVQEYRTADQRVWAVQKRLLAANGLAMTQSRALRGPRGQGADGGSCGPGHLGSRETHGLLFCLGRVRGTLARRGPVHASNALPTTHDLQPTASDPLMRCSSMPPIHDKFGATDLNLLSVGPNRC